MRVLKVYRVIAPKLNRFTTLNINVRSISLTSKVNDIEKFQKILASNTNLKAALSDPTVLAEVKELINILKEKGFDMTKGEKPSFSLMLQVLNDKLVMEKVNSLQTLLQSKGVQLDSKSMMELFNGKK